MLESQGIFQLAARSETNAALSRSIAAGHGAPHSVFEKSAQGTRRGTGFDLSAFAVSANTTIRAILQAAWDEVTKDEKRITPDMLQRLEKASKSDNKEIAAERLRQAKAKLHALKLQAQIAAAAGDKKALRRIAQLAAQAAHEVASAARGVAGGIVAGATGAADGATGGTVPIAAPGTSPGIPDDERQQQDAAAQNSDDGRDALQKLGDAARAAIIEARGIVAFASQAARQRRRHGESGDDDFRDLKQSVQEAAQDLDRTLNEAGRALTADSAPAGPDAVSAIETTTLAVQVTTEVTVTASIVI